MYQKKLVGVFGDPVDDNPSVVIEQVAFDYMKLPMEYLTIQVKQGDLKAAIEGLRAMNFTGINITMPHKIDVLQYLDYVADDAKIMGAVNTIYVKGGKLYGENTDGKGFMRNLQNGNVPTKGKNVVILGAGGVARAISVELANAGVKHITVVNVIKEEGERLVELLNSKTSVEATFVFWDHKYSVPEKTDILVNATPIGFVNKEEKPNIEYESIHSQMAVCDVIPNSVNTLFLEEAKKIGCNTFNGMQMLVNQGAIAFELWTGLEAPLQVMLDALAKVYGD
jgi:shikimate dehydrogenase